MASTQARIIAATTEEQHAAIDVVHRALGQPLFAAARLADARGQCLREVPVTLTAGDRLIEGTVDLAFDDGEGMTVVDFKTDRATGEQLARYERQVSVYAEAIARVTGRRVHAVLMKV
jgi:ATP-dependent exoDNAse (exonuclease V) beta subunit